MFNIGGNEYRLVVKVWFAGQNVWIKFIGTQEVIIMLVDAYEARNHHIDPPDPIEAILFRMDQQGLSRNDLIPMIGSRVGLTDRPEMKKPPDESGGFRWS